LSPIRRLLPGFALVDVAGLRWRITVRPMHRTLPAALSIGAAALALTVIPASSADATPHAGQYCAPKGGTYRTATAALICAPAQLASGRKDLTYRWRNITGPAGPQGARGAPGAAGSAGPACPGGYAQQQIQVQAIPAGATDPTWVQIMACVAPLTQGNPTPTITPTSTPTSSVTGSAGLDPRFPTCAAAKAAGYGPYHVTVDPEYWWYTDADHDGWDCE
jgi:hypothetical protein